MGWRFSARFIITGLAVKGLISISSKIVYLSSFSCMFNPISTLPEHLHSTSLSHAKTT